MFQEADKFYQEMGLLPMTPLFWEKSRVVAPKEGSGVEMACNPSGRDFCQRTPLGRNADYRIIMCAEVNQKDFSTIHHEIVRQSKASFFFKNLNISFTFLTLSFRVPSSTTCITLICQSPFVMVRIQGSMGL
jgi:hypothetical protein